MLLHAKPKEASGEAAINNYNNNLFLIRRKLTSEYDQIAISEGVIVT